MSDERVRIVQALCPLRHCITAVVYGPVVEEDRLVADVLRRTLEQAVAHQILNPRCELCGAPPDQWTYEDRATIFSTKEEAEPHLRAVEVAQAFTRHALSSRGAGKN